MPGGIELELFARAPEAIANQDRAAARALSLRFMAVHYSMSSWRKIRINLHAGAVSISPRSILAWSQEAKAAARVWSAALASPVLRAMGPACWPPHSAVAPI